MSAPEGFAAFVHLSYFLPATLNGNMQIVSAVGSHNLASQTALDSVAAGTSSRHGDQLAVAAAESDLRKRQGLSQVCVVPARSVPLAAKIFSSQGEE